MKKNILLLVTFLIISLWGNSQQMMMNTPQQPDLSTTGMAVRATTPMMIADDWYCNTTGVVDQIVIWGGWLYDLMSPDASFTLRIYSDVPATEQTPSHPGTILWEYVATAGTYPDPIATPIPNGEGYYNPENQLYIMPGDVTAWYYSFPLPASNQYSVTAGTIYWLMVTATPGSNPNAQFGWKVSMDHWNDKAVWTLAGTYWAPMVYPPQHPYMGLSVDMSFIIFGTSLFQACCFPNGNCQDMDPASCLQMGGTPMGQGNYCANVSCAPATEACCWPDGTCSLLPPMICSGEGGTPKGPGSTCQPNPCLEDKDYGDAPEGSLAYPASGVVGNYPTCISVGPATFIEHSNFGAYFGPLVDFENDGNAGLCPFFNPNQYDQDECWQDNDAGLIMPGSFTITGQIGSEIVAACPSTFPLPLGNTCSPAIWGQNIDINVTNQMPNQSIGYVNVLVDWNQNGSWGGNSVCQVGDVTVNVFEHLLMNFPIPNGYLGPLSALFTLNPVFSPGFILGPNPGYVWVRFSITEAPVAANWDGSGSFEDGETEDYLLQINQASQQDFDWGDAPDPNYPTLAVSNGAVHQILQGFTLGNLIDSEMDGQPQPQAQGDDMNGIDDEDGVTLNWGQNCGSPNNITVVAPLGGKLDAFVDFNADGDWTDAGEQTFTSYQLIPGNNILNYIVPANASSNTTFSRYRLSQTGGLSSTGPAMSGEVEDYQENFNPTGAFKWVVSPDPQLPGIHAHDAMVNGIYQKIVAADDWLCQGGNITDFHWQGVYENAGSGIDHFHLSIHNNDPNTCLPVEPEIWGADVPLSALNETPSGVVNGQGLMIYNYFYYLPIPFNQIAGNRYWFDITAVSVSANSPALWLWCEAARSHLPVLCTAATKTITAGSGSIWQPVNWPNGTHSDMALAISTEFTQEMEYGDAPDSYQTLLASNGARHDNIVPNLWMGVVKDLELNGQPTPGANGDDLNNIADEDGVVFNTPLIKGQNATLTVTANQANAYIDGWIDFNVDGDFLDPGEQFIIDVLSVNGPNIFNLIIPNNAVTDTTYLRFRISTVPGLPCFGYAPEGEVEDYMKVIESPAPSIDFGDAPDSPYPTLLANNGARHMIVPAVFLGTFIDGEVDGQPSTLADGDDLNNQDDEDGVIVVWGGITGSPVHIKVQASVPGFLDAWGDFNNDGDWADAGENIFNSTPLIAGGNYLSFVVPATADTNGVYYRYRFSQQGGLSYIGMAADGEVEDYKGVITHDSVIKWGQPRNMDYPGLHAHDGIVTQSSVSIYLADDWLCSGGQVTKIVWYGGYENPGSGINYFNLKILPNDPSSCLPGMPPLLDVNIPLGLLNETSTGNYTNDGILVYKYTYDLPTPFAQLSGTQYWLGLSSYSFNIQNPAIWRWCEAARSHVPALCKTAHMTVTNGILGPWLTLSPFNNRYSEMAFEIISSPEMPSEYFIRVGDYLLAESWHNWIGGINDTTPVQLLAFDPDNMISQVIFSYSFVPGSWVIFDVDNDGSDLRSGLGGACEIGDGWTGYLANSEIPQIFTPVYFKTEITLITGEVIEFVRTEPITYDPNPPSSVTINVNDWQTLETSVLNWDVNPIMANLSLAEAWVERKDGYFNKGIPHASQLNPLFEKGGIAYCAPTAAAACLTYFAPQYPNITGGYDLPQLTMALANRFYTDPDSGTYCEDMANGLRKWINLHGGGFTVRLENNWEKNQAGQWVSTFNMEDWITMRNELERGQDVLAQWNWVDANGVTRKGHITTFNSILNRPSFQNVVDFMDPYTGDEEVGTLNGSNGRLNGYSNGSAAHPEYSNLTAQLGSYIIVCPAEQMSHPAIGKIKPGYDPPADTFVLRLPGLYWLRVVTVDNDGFSWRKDLVINRLAVDYGDVPDSYQTLFASNGARHLIDTVTYLGSLIDADDDGHPCPLAECDDSMDLDDEDGVTFPWQFQNGNPAVVVVNAHHSNGFLNVWIDYNKDGDWNEDNEHVFADKVLHAGNNILGFVIPAAAQTGDTYARFRYSTAQGLSWFGLAPDGEVEDYLVPIVPSPTGIKWQQPFDPEHSGYHAHDYIMNSQPAEENYADDWICPGGVVTDIHWWGNYEVSNGVELRNSGIDHFTINIYNELAGCVVGTNPLVTYTVPLANVAETATGVMTAEGSMIYEYTHYLAVPFNQVQGNLYWISITAHSLTPSYPAIWRWNESNRTETPILCTTKTRSVFAGQPGPWNDVTIGTNFFVNMAFSLTNIETESLEYGDAPDSYKTLLASNGARHGSVNPNIFMGAVRDLEINGLPSVAANGDDLNNLADEDGVTFVTPLIQGQQATVTVISSMANALLDGWIDFNGDGDFFDAGEQIIASFNTLFGGNTFIFPVPANATLDTTYARFRISTVPNLPSFGYAPYGEVEDYMLVIQEPAPDLDFGDAPDPYPTTLAANGARHLLGGNLWMGPLIDAEVNGLPSANALGDDLNNLDDEDGVSFPWQFQKGNAAVAVVNANSGGGFLNVWIDYNKDGDWNDDNEHVFVDKVLHAGNNWLGFVIPAAAQIGDTYARFRYCSVQGLSYTGLASDGEVEDYLVPIVPSPTGIKWQQPFDPQHSGYHAHDYIMNSQPAEENFADDWICPGGVVTDIHWWGNYEVSNGVELRNSGIDHFTINIYNELAGCVVGTNPLVTYTVPLANVAETATGVMTAEGSMIYEYTHYLAVPFNQVQGNLYWISITAHSLTPSYPAIWRWNESIRTDTPILCTTKTRSVFAGQPGPWNDVTIGTNFFVNMAFSLTNIETESLEYGDAPDSYKTLLASNGARHGSVNPNIFMGAVRDLEINGLPSVAANGDDLNNLADEDGVTFNTPLVQGQQANVTVISSMANALLDGWIDFNGDGDFFDAGEQIIASFNTLFGGNTFNFPVPANATLDTTYARFRISTVPNLPSFGYAPYGEVEDYMLVIQEPAPDMDFSDAPDPTYPTLLVNNGARHAVSALTLGNLIDVELNGQPNANAIGDDLNNLDDEDGVVFNTAMIQGQNTTLTVTASQGGGWLNAWADFNRDGDWNEGGEQIFTNTPLLAGANNLFFNVPNNAILGKTFLRFRLSTTQNLGYTGAADDGEVEDYVNFIVQPGESKMHWPQMPDLNPNGNGIDIDVAWSSAADDFLCTQSGAINHIRIWFSFASDILPSTGPGGDTVQLILHADIPAGGEFQYSRPGEILWSRIYDPGSYTYKLVNDSIPQWWYDPATQIWQANNNDTTYRFDFPVVNDPFIQTQGTIYWLEVKYLHPDFFVDGTLGWKSTPKSQQWNDAAVWLNPNNPNFPFGWVPLAYPPGHPDQGQPIGLSFIIYNQPPSSEITGIVTYNNQSQTPMTNTTVNLYSGLTLVGSTLTNTDGSFNFTNLPPGSYSLSGFSSRPWEGVNSADALLIMRHFVHYITLTGINAKAADVTGTNGINSVDAFTDARRFVGYINSFPVGDWAFETPSVIIPYSGTFYQNIKALCYGDVDGSHNPSLKKEPAVSLEQSEYLQWDGQSGIVIPVKVNENVSTSAISLVIYYPPELHIDKVEFIGGEQNFLYKAENGELRVSWYNIIPKTLKNGETVFNIYGSLASLPSSPYLILSPECEFADIEGITLSNITLLAPTIVKTNTPDFFLAQNIPNPFSTTTQIVYSLPVEGIVTLVIRDLMGSPVVNIFTNKMNDSGLHSYLFDGGSLPQGVYYCTIHFKTSVNTYTQTIKISIIR